MMNKNRMLSVLARVLTVSTLALLATFSGGVRLASATTPASMTISSSAGSVGSVVEVSGNVGSACTSQYQKVSVAFATRPANQPADAVIVVPMVNEGGGWSTAFEIPDFLWWSAATGPSERVIPGVYYLTVSDSCAAGGALSKAYTVTSTVPLPSRFVTMASTPDGHGYWLTQAGGGVYSFGDAPFLGSLPGMKVTPSAPITSMAATPDGKGYWLVGADGGVFAFGDASYYGSLPGSNVRPSGPIVAITPTHDGKGYWLVGADGGVFGFGDATFYGASVGVGTVVVSGIATSPDTRGYFLEWLNGNVESRGDATVFNPLGTTTPSAFGSWFTGIAATADGQGAWRVATDGGVFALGDAIFYGSLGNVDLAAPIVGIDRAPDGKGYWLVGADGGVFTFGSARFYGSAAGSGLPW